jgi:hypothetical protein
VQTALLQAVLGEKEAAVQLLLKRGADFTKVDNDGRTALSMAREMKYEAIVTLLEDAYAQRESQGVTDEVPGPAFADALGDDERPSSVSQRAQVAVQTAIEEATGISKG